jgi:hypothetical protein
VSGSSWTSTVSKAALTILLVAAVAYGAWWLLRGLIVPLIVLVVLIAIFRLAFGSFRHERF